MNKVLVTVLFLFFLLYGLLCAQSSVVQYQYDVLNRLTRIDYPDGSSIVYTYDAVGNRLTETITSTTAPTANFSATPTTGHAPLQVQFTDASVPGTNPIISWEWDFDNDGVVDMTGQGPHTYTYNNEGTYSVRLVVSDGSLFDEEVKTNYIIVTTPGLDPPDIDISTFTLSFTVMAGGADTATIKIFNRALPGADNLHWVISEPVPGCDWLTVSPDSGNIAAGDSQFVDIIIDASILAVGNYICTLDVNSNDPDEPTLQIQVNLTVISQGQGGIVFEDNFDRTELGSDWQTDIPPDGSSITIVGYPPNGNLRLYNPDASGTQTQALIVAPGTSLSDAKLSFYLDNGPSERMNNITRIFLRYINRGNTYFVDVTEDNYNAPERQKVILKKAVNGVVTVLYEQNGILLDPGIYEFSIIGDHLRFRNIGGGTNIDVSVIDSELTGPGLAGVEVNEETTLLDDVRLISMVPPIANFTADPLSGIAPLTVSFTDSSIAGTDPIISWEWDFDNDGVIDVTGQGPHSYTYTFPGSYSVKLRVSDGTFFDEKLKPNYITVNSQTGFEISGQITYCSSGLPVSNTSVILSGDVSSSTQTDQSGFYVFQNLLSGNYTVTPSKIGDIGAFTISCYDAALCAQFALGINQADHCDSVACDVDEDGNILTFDAALICRYALGLPPFGSNDHVGEWRFEPASRSYPFLNSNQLNQDYTALLLGDVDGNWAPTTTKPISGELVKEEEYYDLKNLQVVAGELLSIPLSVEASDKVISVDIDLRYDPQVLEFIEVSRTDLSKEFEVLTNVEKGHIRVGAYNIRSVEKSGEFLSLKFKVVGAVGQKSSLNLDRYQLNNSIVKHAEVNFVVSPSIPEKFALYQNYPNPFNPISTIRIALPEDSKVTLKIYNMLGQQVRTLVNGTLKAGYYKFIWDGRNDQGMLAASGIYFYRFVAEGQTKTFAKVRKMVLMK